MSDSLQIYVLGGAALMGWSLAGYCFRLLMRGKLLTEREWLAQEKRIETKDRQLDAVLRQNSLLLTEGLPLTNKVLDGVRQAVESK